MIFTTYSPVTSLRPNSGDVPQRGNLILRNLLNQTAGERSAVDTLAERNAIPVGTTLENDGLSSGQREVGMIVYVAEDATQYQLNIPGYNALTDPQKLAALADDANWIALGGGGGVESLAPNTGDPAQTGALVLRNLLNATAGLVQTVATLADRDALTTGASLTNSGLASGQRLVGMLVEVLEDAQLYQLRIPGYNALTDPQKLAALANNANWSVVGDGLYVPVPLAPYTILVTADEYTLQKTEGLGGFINQIQYQNGFANVSIEATSPDGTAQAQASASGFNNSGVAQHFMNLAAIVNGIKVGYTCSYDESNGEVKIWLGPQTAPFPNATGWVVQLIPNAEWTSFQTAYPTFAQMFQKLGLVTN